MNLPLEPWRRAQRGLHTVVLGIPLGEAPHDLRVVRVSCDVPPSTLGPLLEARARIERALGTAAPFVEVARARVITGLRRHLLGDLPSVTNEGTLVDVCNRLAALGPAALVLDAADAADAASLDMLRHILSRPGWLRLPIVLVMRGEALPMAAAQLVDALRAAGGEEAIVRASSGEPPQAHEAKAAHEHAEHGPRTTPLPSTRGFDLRALPADVLRVLRVLSIAGSGSEAQVIAAALDTNELAVLDAMQRAADAGVPIEDRGEGRFYLKDGAIGDLRASILPSLAQALHRRVAAILANDAKAPAASATAPAIAAPQNGEDAPRPGNAWDVMQAAPPPTMRLPGMPDSKSAASTGASERARQSDAPSDAQSTERSLARSTDPAAARLADEAMARAGLRTVQAPDEGDEADARIAEDAIAQAARQAVLDAAERAEEAAAKSASEAERSAREAAIEAARKAEAEAKERAARDILAAMDEASKRAAEEAERRAAGRSVELDAERAAEEAAAHAADEARRTRDAMAAKDAADRRAAEEIASHAVERAQREIADEERAPVYYKPFTGATPPPIVARPAGKWLSPLANEPARRPARSVETRRFSPRDEAHDTPRTSAPERGPGGTSRERVEVHEVTGRPENEGRGARGSDSMPPRDSQPPRAPDDARAARHLAAAGDPEAAIDRYFKAMQKAAEAAAYPQAVAHARAALALLEQLPSSEERRRMRVQLLLETGRVLWHGAGPDDSFTLQGALRVLESARTSLHAGDPAEVVADVAVTIAGILYEIGDIASLTRALEELANASRALSEAGEPQAAARLFNDQASVYIRLGDPVRAAHLLTESRNIFEKAAKSDPVAMIEMAETDHLFARILLHVPARPGREQDALSLGLDHALAAERAFRTLGAPREAGRVLETMGRIELRKGRLARAAERITAAVQLQESIGDVVGLSRSTEALAQVMAAGGQFREALNLLADSIVLNFEKGSPLGLAFARRALESIASNEAARASAGELLVEIESRLSALEEKLGRIPIPGTPDTSAQN